MNEILITTLVSVKYFLIFVYGKIVKDSQKIAKDSQR